MQKTVIEDLKNVELVTPLLENIKERKRLNLLRMLDDKFALLSDFIVEDLGFDDTIEELYNKSLKEISILSSFLIYYCF